MANNMTSDQQKVLNDMAEYGKHLQELAFENTGKYVVAGYAGNSTETSKLYCYCGEGKGYKGAPLMPASAIAVVYTSKEAAERKSSLLKYSNAYGERITLKAMPANEYYWLLFDETCRVMQLAEQMAQEANNRK